MQRVNKFCAYYPCHDPLEDCTFCYCPFYPCGIDTLGYNIHVEASGQDVWACDRCTYFHRTKTVDRLLDSLRSDRDNYLSDFIQGEC